MQVSIEAVSLIVATVSVLVAWLGHSNGKRQAHERSVIAQAKLASEQQNNLHAHTESLKAAWDRLHKIDEDMSVLVERIGELDKTAALNNKDIAQLTKEMDRLVEMHSQLYRLMSAVFKQRDVLEISK